MYPKLEVIFYLVLDLISSMQKATWTPPLTPNHSDCNTLMRDHRYSKHLCTIHSNTNILDKPCVLS
jgi:hypothetical protein